jgi:acyl-CoA thioester hydrolase
MWWETYRGVVHPWLCDTFGHMNVRWYLHHFDDAAFHIWPLLGLSLQRMEEEYGVHTVVANVKIDYLRELRDGDLFVVKSAFTRVGSKSCTYTQKMFHADTGVHHATHEGIEVFFDPKARKAAAMPEGIRALLKEHEADPAGP